MPDFDAQWAYKMLVEVFPNTEYYYHLAGAIVGLDDWIIVVTPSNEGGGHRDDYTIGIYRFPWSDNPDPVVDMFDVHKSKMVETVEYLFDVAHITRDEALTAILNMRARRQAIEASA